VDAFCALKANAKIDSLIQDAERNLAAAQAANAVTQQSSFAVLSLPSFDTGAIDALLKRNLPDLETAAAAPRAIALQQIGHWSGDVGCRWHTAHLPLPQRSRPRKSARFAIRASATRP